jgi:hypothetical protein
MWISSTIWSVHHFTSHRIKSNRHHSIDAAISFSHKSVIKSNPMPFVHFYFHYQVEHHVHYNAPLSIIFTMNKRLLNLIVYHRYDTCQVLNDVGHWMMTVFSSFMNMTYHMWIIVQHCRLTTMHMYLTQSKISMALIHDQEQRRQLSVKFGKFQIECYQWWQSVIKYFLFNISFTCM